MGALRGALSRQHDTAWKLLDFHLSDLTDAECLWRPTPQGLHVFPDVGVWRAGWPESEGYDQGPPSIGWLTWHIGFWWSTVLDRCFGSGSLRREDVFWPGTADGVREWLDGLHREWTLRLSDLTDEQLASTDLTRWPLQDRPFAELWGWLNLELMKNAAEIGYCRFLYHGRGSRGEG